MLTSAPLTKVTGEEHCRHLNSNQGSNSKLCGNHCMHPHALAGKKRKKKKLVSLKNVLDKAVKIIKSIKSQP